MMYVAVKFIPPSPFGGIVLLSGFGIALVGGFASRAAMLKSNHLTTATRRRAIVIRGMIEKTKTSRNEKFSSAAATIAHYFKLNRMLSCSQGDMFGAQIEAILSPTNAGGAHRFDGRFDPVTWQGSIQ